MKNIDFRLNQAARQYSEAIDIHGELPDSANYWIRKYLNAPLREMWGVEDVNEFYAKCIAEIAAENPDKKIRIISLGCGDGQVELKTCQLLLKGGVRNVFFEGSDVADGAIRRAEISGSAAGLNDFLKFHVSTYDMLFNSHVDVVIANQVLHHFTDLEGLFDTIKRSIASHGIFVSCDMIGRNGHMLWPEALAIMDSIWERLNDRQKYNHVLRRVEQKYSNWDNSKEANEGIRAQDILPELIKRFRFEKFLAAGNLGIALFGRHFGANFDPKLRSDLAFIDQVNELDFNLIDVGYLKPVLMCTCISNRDVPAEHYRHWSPDFCLRKESPLQLADTAFPPFGEIIQFGERLHSTSFLKRGWSSPEDGGVWSNDTYSEVCIPIEDELLGQTVQLDIWGTQFVPENDAAGPVRIMVNGTPAGEVVFGGSPSQAVCLAYGANIGREALLRFEYSKTFCPSDLGLSEDVRLLSVHLMAIKLSVVETDEALAEEMRAKLRLLQPPGASS